MLTETKSGIFQENKLANFGFLVFSEKWNRQFFTLIFTFHYFSYINDILNSTKTWSLSLGSRSKSSTPISSSIENYSGSDNMIVKYIISIRFTSRFMNFKFFFSYSYLQQFFCFSLNSFYGLVFTWDGYNTFLPF